MAKINFGGIVQDARGKQNGLVYSKNASGSYVRRKSSPVNPQSDRQQTVRSTFGTLAQAWTGGLLDSDRAAWVAFAALYPITDVFGNSITLNGMNYFIKVNAALINAGMSELTDPPSSNATVPIPIGGTLTADSSTPALTFQQTALAPDSGDKFYIFGTTGYPAGRTSVKALYRFIGVKTPATTGIPATIDITTLWTNKFGSPVSGQNLSVLISTINSEVGIPTLGQPLTASWA